MPTDPNQPGGPGNNQPNVNVDPNTINVLGQMATALDVINKGLDEMNRKAAEHERLLKATATQVEDIADEYRDARKVVGDYIQAGEDMEENYKRTVALGKKLKSMDKDKLDTVKEARRELEKLKKMYEQNLAVAKKETKETVAMRANLKKLNEVLHTMQPEGKLVGAEWQKVADVIGMAARNAKQLATATASLGKTGTTLKGLTGIFGAMGIGKGISQKIDRRLEQIEEVKEKVKESREGRAAVARKANDEKRAGHVEAIKQKAKESGFGNLVDAEGNVTTKAGHQMLAKRMGFGEGTDKYNKFIAGEEAGGALGGAGAEAGTEAAAGWTEAMGTAEGAIEGLVAGFEDLILELTVAAPEIMIPLEILGAAIAMLTKTYFAQNKEIEKQLGKGGLFTQLGIGPGSAFAGARAGLTPGASTGVLSGFSYERNLAMAGAMATGGHTFNDAFRQDEQGNLTGADVANQAPGGYGQFMRGGLGEAQRIVMGVSRVGGMDDTEGVENLMKLLGEYRENMASAETFMTQLNKDTQAAGISTTKYLKIIDEVTSAFDRMGKNLEEVTGIMRDLSRYGDISSESLKDMMEFLAKGQEKTTKGRVPIATYMESQKPKFILEAERNSTKNVLANMVEDFNKEGRRYGQSDLNIQDAIDKGQYEKAFSLLSEKDQDINSLPPEVRKEQKEKQAQIAGQIRRYRGMMDPNSFGRSTAAMGQPEDMVQLSSNLLSGINTALKLSGASLTELQHGGATPTQRMMVQSLQDMFGETKLNEGFELLRRQATHRLADVDKITNPAQKETAQKELFNEFFNQAKRRPKGIKIALDNAGIKIADEAQGTAEDAYDAMKKQNVDMSKFLAGQRDDIASSDENAASVIDAQGEAAHATTTELAKNLDTMEGMAERTQTVQEILEHIFKPLMNKMLGYIETMATDIDKLVGFFTHGVIGGNMQDDQKRMAKDMGEIPDALTKLFAQGEAMKNDPTKNAELKKTEEMIKYLQGIQEQGGLLSQDDQDQFEAAMKTIQGGGMPNAPGGANDLGSNFGKGVGFLTDTLPALLKSLPALAQGGGMVLHQHFDAHYQQDTTSPSGMGRSPKESPQQQKGKPMGIDPSTGKPFTSI